MMNFSVDLCNWRGKHLLVSTTTVWQGWDCCCNATQCLFTGQFNENKKCSCMYITNWCYYTHHACMTFVVKGQFSRMFDQQGPPTPSNEFYLHGREECYMKKANLYNYKCKLNYLSYYINNMSTKKIQHIFAFIQTCGSHSDIGTT
jgi:hypothetical protein